MLRVARQRILSRHHMKKILVGVVIGVCLPFLAGYLFVIFGGVPVATKESPLPLERFLASKALHAAMGPDEDKPSLLPADETNLLAGAHVYEAHCAGYTFVTRRRSISRPSSSIWRRSNSPPSISKREKECRSATRRAQ